MEDVRRIHKRRGFRDIGYHFVIEDDGAIRHGRGLHHSGAHARGHNRNSIGIVYTGGLGFDGKGITGPNPVQQAALRRLIDSLITVFPTLKRERVIGHRDTGSNKDCPCFNVEDWMQTGVVEVSRNFA